MRNSRPGIRARIIVTSLYLVVTISLAFGCLSCGCAPRPFISSISPNSATAGGGQFVLTVNGSDFRHDSVVNWNGSLRVTMFVSSHELEVGITAADIARPGSLLVLVFNPPDTNSTTVSGAISMGGIIAAGCSSKDSNAVSFAINP
jgi:IPT/TIG domain